MFDASGMRTIYHVKNGPQLMYSIDAAHALQFSNEWRTKPKFSQDELQAYLTAEVEAAVALAKETGTVEDQRKADALARQNDKLLKEIAARGPVEEPPVEIPGDWQDGKPSERIALAVKLGAERKGLTAAKADEFIDAEVEARAAEAAGGQK